MKSIVISLVLAAGLIGNSARAMDVETGNVSRPEDKFDFWSLKPIQRAPLPKLGSLDAQWVRTPIDAFVIAKLREKGLTPSPEADRRTLIRRLYFDLIGLPPMPEAVEAFAADPDPLAYEKLIENLLARTAYGERWARHWLDVVHYGDTHGYDKDQPRPNAWPYRDYVIRSFNEDKPYTRFVLEQIAGDILFPDTIDGIVATGFIAAGPWDLIGHMEVPEEKIDGKIARSLDRDDMVANTMNTFASLTVQCARCHNHKFDPVTQEDYYSMQAVFAALDRADRSFDADPKLTRKRLEFEKSQEKWTAEKEALETEIKKLAGEELSALDKKISELQKESKKGNSEGSGSVLTQLAKLGEERTTLLERLMPPSLKGKRAEIDQGLKAVGEELGKLPKPMKVYAGTIHYGKGTFRGTGHQGGKPRLIQVLSRGDVQNPGKVVGPGTVPIIPAVDSRFALKEDHAEGARRVELAKWIVDRRNPLTWRSIVNRVWQYHFGRGIVDSPNDFGRMGQLPTHPELLDWLAVEFRDGGESIKQLHRMILNSSTYRQSSGANEALAKLDSNNQFLWRMNRRRLEAEAIRDAVLAVSGKLAPTLFGPAFQDFVVEKPEHSPHYQYHLHDPEDPRSHRRSIYRFLVRSQPQPFMQTLDCADPSLMVDKRNETLTALQALALLNNRFMVVMSKHMAGRIQEMADSPEEQIRAAFRLALGRVPGSEELSRLADYARKHGLANTCRVILNLNEFVFVD